MSAAAARKAVAESPTATDEILRHLAEQSRLLRAILAELQKRPHAESQVQRCAPAIREDFLQVVWALMADRQWTCEELLDEAQLGTSPEHARVRATLADMGVGGADRKKLGCYLRPRVDATAGGFGLARHDANRDGARVWSVRRV